MILAGDQGGSWPLVPQGRGCRRPPRPLPPALVSLSPSFPLVQQGRVQVLSPSWEGQTGLLFQCM